MNSIRVHRLKKTWSAGFYDFPEAEIGYYTIERTYDEIQKTISKIHEQYLKYVEKTAYNPDIIIINDIDFMFIEMYYRMIKWNWNSPVERHDKIAKLFGMEVLVTESRKVTFARKP